MNWETLYCPNPACRLYGVRWRQSLLVKNGSSRGYKQAVCRACGQSVVLRYGTAYVDAGQQAYKQQYRDRVLTNLQRKARVFGYQLVHVEDTGRAQAAATL